MGSKVIVLFFCQTLFAELRHCLEPLEFEVVAIVTHARSADEPRFVQRSVLKYAAGAVNNIFEPSSSRLDRILTGKRNLTSDTDDTGNMILRKRSNKNLIALMKLGVLASSQIFP